MTPPSHNDHMLFQIRCAGCNAPGAPVCTTCRFALVGRLPQPGSHGVQAAVPFTGRARDVILGLKYRNRRQVAAHLAGLVVNRIVANRDHVDIDVVTWAPTSASRRRERGFDQGEAIARNVARQLGLPCRRLIERSARNGPTQTGRPRLERLHGPDFRVRPNVGGLRVLIVDDVVTTGATLASAERALSEAGVESVARYAVAATPVASTAAANRRRPRLELVGPRAAA